MRLPFLLCSILWSVSAGKPISQSPCTFGQLPMLQVVSKQSKHQIDRTEKLQLPSKKKEANWSFGIKIQTPQLLYLQPQSWRIIYPHTSKISESFWLNLNWFTLPQFVPCSQFRKQKQPLKMFIWRCHYSSCIIKMYRVHQLASWWWPVSRELSCSVAERSRSASFLLFLKRLNTQDTPTKFTFFPGLNCLHNHFWFFNG